MGYEQILVTDGLSRSAQRGAPLQRRETLGEDHGGAAECGPARGPHLAGGGLSRGQGGERREESQCRISREVRR